LGEPSAPSSLIFLDCELQDFLGGPVQKCFAECPEKDLQGEVFLQIRGGWGKKEQDPALGHSEESEFQGLFWGRCL
jgi:hypothetical protein